MLNSWCAFYTLLLDINVSVKDPVGKTLLAVLSII